MIYFTSDPHLFHSREFLWRPRGFNSEQEHREHFLAEWDRLITDEDDIYVVGDFFLGSDLDKVREIASQLKGRIHLIIGNHDTDKKIELYKELPNFVEIVYATKIKYRKREFYISHYKTDTSNLEADPCNCVINIHGHIHTKEVHYNDIPYQINVSLDAQQNRIVSIDEVIEMFNNKVKECISYL